MPRGSGAAWIEIESVAIRTTGAGVVANTCTVLACVEKTEVTTSELCPAVQHAWLESGDAGMGLL